MIDLDQTTRDLALIASDHAMLGAFRLQHPAFVDLCAVIAEPPKVEKAVGPFPPISSLTALQTAIFDNWWQSGRRTTGKVNRYGLAVEFWTVADPKVTKKASYQHKANLILLDAKGLQKWLKERIAKNDKNVHPMSWEYLSDLTTIQGQMLSDDLIALMMTVDEDNRQVFFDGQFIFGQITDRGADFALISEGERFDLPPFVRTDPRGEPFAEPKNRSRGRVILQSRFYNGNGDYPVWPTHDPLAGDMAAAA